MELLCKAMTDISVNRLSTIALWLFQLWHLFAFRIELAGMFGDQVISLLSPQNPVSLSQGSKEPLWEGIVMSQALQAFRNHSILFPDHIIPPLNKTSWSRKSEYFEIYWMNLFFLNKGWHGERKCRFVVHIGKRQALSCALNIYHFCPKQSFPATTFTSCMCASRVTKERW